MRCKCMRRRRMERKQEEEEEEEKQQQRQWRRPKRGRQRSRQRRRRNENTLHYRVSLKQGKFRGKRKLLTSDHAEHSITGKVTNKPHVGTTIYSPSRRHKRPKSFRLLCGASFVVINRLVGLVVKASASRAEDPGWNPCCNGIFRGRVIPVT